MPEHAVDAVLVVLLGCCTVSDIRHGRVPNAITYPAILLGLTLATFGAPGLRSAVGGLVAGAAPLYVAFALGALGGGNIKLMAAVGALKGLSFAVTALFCSVLAGGIWAALVLVWSGQARGVLADVGTALSRGRAESGGMPPRGGALPFSVAIAVGTVTTLLLEWRRA